MKTLKLKFSCLIASAKFQTTMGAFHNPTLVSNYQKLYLNVITVNGTLGVRFGHEGCYCDFGGF